MATDPPWTRGHPPFGWRWKRSAAALAHAGAGADGLAGAAEDVLDDAAEGEDDDDDQGGDAGDEEAVLDGRGAALVHPGEASVQRDADVVEHGGGLLEWVLGGSTFLVSRNGTLRRIPRSNAMRGPVGLAAEWPSEAVRLADRLRRDDAPLWHVSCTRPT